MLVYATNLPQWQNKPLRTIIEHDTNKSVYLINDANAATIAQTIGEDKDMIVFVTVSSGIGGGIVFKGKLIEGKNGYAGEFGTIIVSDEDRNHPSLYKGSLETFCSGISLGKRASEIYNDDLEAKDVFEKYGKKEEKAIEIVEEWIEYFSKAMANIYQIIEPEVIYLGGSVILNNPWLLKKIEEKTKTMVLKGLSEYINFTIAKFKEDAGIIGAAYNSTLEK